MTPLPKRRLSKARKGKRRQAIRLTLKNLVLCPSCHQPKLPHIVCPSCGTYKDKVIIIHKVKKKKES